MWLTMEFHICLSMLFVENHMIDYSKIELLLGLQPHLPSGPYIFNLQIGLGQLNRNSSREEGSFRVTESALEFRQTQLYFH
jgi:hypothetical protein